MKNCEYLNVQIRRQTESQSGGGVFFARSVVVIGFMFKYSSGRAVDLVLVLHVAAFELNLVFEPTVVDVALNLKFIDIRGVNSGVFERCRLCGFLTYAGCADIFLVMIIVVIDRLGFKLDDRAGSVNLALDESIVMVNPGLREDGVFSRNSGVLQCYRFRGFKPDFVCLFRSRSDDDCFVSVVAVCFLFDYRAGVGVDLVLVFYTVVVYIDVIVSRIFVYIIIDLNTHLIGGDSGVFQRGGHCRVLLYRHSRCADFYKVFELIHRKCREFREIK